MFAPVSSLSENVHVCSCQLSLREYECLFLLVVSQKMCMSVPVRECACLFLLLVSRGICMSVRIKIYFVS